MEKIDQVLSGCRSVAILGHVHPDGDCVGSCLGLYNYIQKRYPAMETDIYLEPFQKEFAFLKGADQVHYGFETEKVYELCIVCDASDRKRLGGGAEILDKAGRTISIDHHKTNTGFAGLTLMQADISSTCELLYELMEEDQVDREIAACLYTGMIHDTGVFKYQSATARTMEIAGKLMATGIPFTDIIDRTFYQKNYRQSKAMGQALLNSSLYAQGKLICSVLTARELAGFQATSMDMEGIVEQLRLVEDVEVSAFLYEMEPETFKASMRSREYVDVSEIAAAFGGGGHARAAGCTLHGSREEVMCRLLNRLEKECLRDGTK